MSEQASQNNELRLPNLERQPFEPRALQSIILSTLTSCMAIIACIPLFSVLIMLLYRGGKRITFEVFYALPPTAFDVGGGFGNAIVGTLFMVGIASLISVPFGILAAIYLAELAQRAKLPQWPASAPRCSVVCPLFWQVCSPMRQLCWLWEATRPGLAVLPCPSSWYPRSCSLRKRPLKWYHDQ